MSGRIQGASPTDPAMTLSHLLALAAGPPHLGSATGAAGPLARWIEAAAPGTWETLAAVAVAAVVWGWSQRPRKRAIGTQSRAARDAV